MANSRYYLIKNQNNSQRKALAEKINFDFSKDSTVKEDHQEGNKDQHIPKDNKNIVRHRDKQKSIDKFIIEKPALQPKEKKQLYMNEDEVKMPSAQRMIRRRSTILRRNNSDMQQQKISKHPIQLQPSSTKFHRQVLPVLQSTSRTKYKLDSQRNSRRSSKLNFSSVRRSQVVNLVPGSINTS